MVLCYPLQYSYCCLFCTYTAHKKENSHQQKHTIKRKREIRKETEKERALTSPDDKVVAPDSACHVAARFRFRRRCSLSPGHRLDVQDEDVGI